ncbi:hypothetical protein A6U96_09490 [Agrobacterium tumefaciens]|nr:hypothetical protein A6U96_09490 [Agrobacterium tumefaciens]
MNGLTIPLAMPLQLPSGLPALASGLGGGAYRVVPPSEVFAFLKDVFGVNVFKKRRKITHDYVDTNTKPVVTGSTYYVKPGGSDAAAGTSWATAFATISRAMNRIMFDGVSQSLVGRIIVDTTAGDIVYMGSAGLQALTCRKSLVIDRLGAGRIKCAAVPGSVTSFAWQPTGTPGIYSAPCSATPGYVLDLSRVVAGSPSYNPQHERLLIGASASSLTPGQYFYDAANTTLYVRTADERVPDGKIIPTATTSGFAWGPQLANQVFWAKGLDIIGGYQMEIDYQYMADASAKAYFSECTEQGTALDGTVMKMPGYMLLNKCAAYDTTGDGFSSYAGANGNTLNESWKAEIDCRARQNGNSSNLANNASTGHDASRTVIINPDYDQSQDRLVHYVYASQCWIIGGKLGRSARPSGATSRTIMVNQGAANRIPCIWLDSVEFVGHSEIDIEASAYGRVGLRDIDMTGLTITTNNNGSVFYF